MWYTRTLKTSEGITYGGVLEFEVDKLPPGDWLRTAFENGLQKAICRTVGGMTFEYERTD